MTRSRFVSALSMLIVLFGTVGVSGALARAESPAPPRAVGVTLNSGPGGETQAYGLAIGAGADAIEAPQPWSTLEPRPRHFELGDVAAIVGGVRSASAIQIMLIPAAIETAQRSVPGDLRRVQWNSPRMIDRYRRLIRHLAPRLSRQVRYVSIANEADIYFSTHRRELPAFLHFARAEIAELRRLVPAARVGVTVTYAGLTSAHPGVARALAGLGEATILTYYPLLGGYRMDSPDTPLHDIPKMIRLAHGRPLVLQEVGYSSAPRLRSSPPAQATFVSNVFEAWDRNPGAIPFLSFYILFDLPGSECRSHTNAATFFCSLGLRYRSGRPKPAWKAFQAGVRGVRGVVGSS